MDTDFWHGIEMLEPNGANWNRFRLRFLNVIRHEELYDHFDGSSKTPTAVQASPTPVKAGSAKETTTTRATAGAITAWEKKENTALYLLTQKLPDSIFVRYMRKETVADMWAAIVRDFTNQLMAKRPYLLSEFMAMRYQKGANLRSEFNRVRMKYEVLWSAGVEISNNDYCLFIIKFLPPGIANFISQLVSTFEICSRLGLLESGTATSSAESPGSTRKEPFTLDPEILMEIATEEWERRDAYRKSRKPQQGSSNDTVSRENLAGSGYSQDRGRRRRRGRSGRQGDCWNCGGRGHRQDVCPSPKLEEKDKQPSTQSSQNNIPGSRAIANNTIFERFAGAWTAIAEVDEDEYDSA